MALALDLVLLSLFQALLASALRANSGKDNLWISIYPYSICDPHYKLKVEDALVIRR